MAESKKKYPELKLKGEEEGKKKQEQIINALKKIGNHSCKNWDVFEVRVKDALKDFDLSPNFIKNVILALSEHDDTADYVLDKKGNKLPDSNLRDSEKVPLKQDIEKYFDREVKPYYPDAWMDRKKDKIGLMRLISLNIFTNTNHQALWKRLKRILKRLRMRWLHPKTKK